MSWRNHKVGLRRLPAAWAFLLVAILTPFGMAAKQAAPPNVLLIVVRDVRWDSLGASGNRSVVTPSLDRLAREGMYFPQTITHVPQSQLSFRTLLMGISAYQREDFTNADTYRRTPSVPQMLQHSGYLTTFIGTWGLDADPKAFGFKQCGLWSSAEACPPVDPTLAPDDAHPAVKQDGFTVDLFASDAIRFLRSNAAHDQPFYLCIANAAPRTKDAAPVVTALDEQVGRILGALEKEGFSSRTEVFFVGTCPSYDSDHTSLASDEAIRVPLIVRAPMFQLAKGANQSSVSTLDVPVTVLRMASVGPPGRWKGRNLIPLLKNQTDMNFNATFSELPEGAGQISTNLAFRLVRSPQFKLVRWRDPAKPDALFHLEADPAETNNCINTVGLESMRDEMQKRLVAAMKSMNDPALKWHK